MRISDWSSDVCSSDLLHVPMLAWLSPSFSVSGCARARTWTSRVGKWLVTVPNARCNLRRDCPTRILRWRFITTTATATTGGHWSILLSPSADCLVASRYSLPKHGYCYVKGTLNRHCKYRSEERRGGKECVSTCRYR